MCLKWDFSGIEGNYATICKQLQIRIISENIFSLILIVYRHRKLGYPLRSSTGIRASPVRIDTTSHTMRGLSGFQRTYKRKMADCTCMMKPTITLLYSYIYTPAIK